MGNYPPAGQEETCGPVVNGCFGSPFQAENLSSNGTAIRCGFAKDPNMICKWFLLLRSLKTLAKPKNIFLDGSVMLTPQECLMASGPNRSHLFLRGPRVYRTSRVLSTGLLRAGPAVLPSYIPRPMNWPDSIYLVDFPG